MSVWEGKEAEQEEESPSSTVDSKTEENLRLELRRPRRTVRAKAKDGRTKKTNKIQRVSEIKVTVNTQPQPFNAAFVWRLLFIFFALLKCDISVFPLQRMAEYSLLSKHE